MNSKKGLAILIIIIIIVVIILGLVGYFVFRGKKEKPLGPSGAPSTQLTGLCHDAAVGDVVCSNGMYSVTKKAVDTSISSRGYVDECSLSDESQIKYMEALEEQGNAALEGISNLTCLTCFDVSHANVSDISPVSNLTNLKELGMCDTNVSDIFPLSNLTELTNLYLSTCPISDISPLSNLTNLKQLGLGFIPISDISPVSNLTNLKYLDLHNDPNLSDISPLSNLTNLVQLNLSNSPVSDISALDNLTANLTNVNLIGTNVSEEDCIKLKEKMKLEQNLRNVTVSCP